jgi:hypothetical protein
MNTGQTVFSQAMERIQKIASSPFSFEKAGLYYK